MPRPYPAAILFALETNLAPEEVAYLTRSDVKKMNLGSFSRQILTSQPLSIKTSYCFWRQDGSSHMPLYGIDLYVFDAWGFVWAELEASYRVMLPFDGEADFADFADRFSLS